MFAFIVSRILQAVPVMFVVSLISFAMFAYVGDPVAIMLGQDYTQAQRDALVRELGLDQPFFIDRKMASLNMPSVLAVWGAAPTSTSTCLAISGNQAGSRRMSTKSGLGMGLASVAQTFMPKP